MNAVKRPMVKGAWKVIKDDYVIEKKIQYGLI